MVGDALGDYEAAKVNEVLYYPILVKKEKESWERFLSEALDTYMDKYQEQVVNEFEKNLSKN